MDLWPPFEYNRQGVAAGIPPKTLSDALKQARRVQREGLPPILTLNHLAHHTGAPYAYLREVVERKKNPYRTFLIHKRGGGLRQICVADPILLSVHRWLACHVLNKRNPHSSSYAYAPQSSVVHCAKMHAGAAWLIKVDVHKFFESISEIQVYRVFRACGYEPLISYELSRLCTRVYQLSPTRYYSEVWSRFTLGEYEAIPSYRYPNKIGHLPQGAATSPMLSNLAMFTIDETLAELADRVGLVYTRYSDDLIFSGGSSCSREKARKFVHDVYAILLRHGLFPKRKKTKIVPPGARKIVLGLLVNGPQPRLTREFRNRISVHLHYLQKFGPVEHAQRRGFRSVLSLQRHIDGLLAFARQVDDPRVTEWCAQAKKINWDLAIEPD
ncbi:MAG: reverse transcriptase family protein [Longimicrobiaceae bacterium]